MPGTETEVKPGETPKVETKPEPKVENKPVVIDLSSKVKIGDKEIPVTEVVEQATKAAVLEGSVYKMFDPRGTTETRIEGVKGALRHLGVPDNEIEEYVKSSFPTQDPTTAKPNGENKPGITAEAELTKKIAKLEADARDARLRTLSKSLDTTINEVLDKDPQVALYYKAAENLGGKEQVEKLRKTLRAQLKDATVRGLHIKRQETGEPADESWIAPTVTEVLPSVFETVGAVIGDPNKIGRAAETDTGMAQLLSTQPLQAPEVGKLKGIPAMDKAVTDWLADGLIRDAAKAGSGTSRV